MNKQEFISRRNALLAQMEPASAAIIFQRPSLNATRIVNTRIASTVIFFI